MHLASHVETIFLLFFCSWLQSTFHNEIHILLGQRISLLPWLLHPHLNLLWMLFADDGNLGEMEPIHQMGQWGPWEPRRDGAHNEASTPALLTRLRIWLGWVPHPAIPMAPREKAFPDKARSSCGPRCSSQGHLQLGTSLPLSSVWLDARVGGGESSNYTFLTGLWLCDYSRRRLTSLLSNKDTPQGFPLCLLSSGAFAVWWGSVIIIYSPDTQPINVLAQRCNHLNMGMIAAVSSRD